MFNNLTSGHSIFTRIMLLFIVASFCLWGIGDIFRQGGGTATIAKVGKMTVSTQEYQSALRNRQEDLREKLGKSYSPELAKKLGIEKQALESILNRLTLEQEAAAQGLVASEDDVAESIAEDPNFQDGEKKFSKDIYLAALQANHRSEQSFIAGLRQQLVTRLLLSTVTGELSAPDDLVEAVYRARFERRSAGLLVIPAGAAKQAQPGEKDIKAYYDAHNDKFLVPQYRSLSYVLLRQEDVRASVTVSDAEVQKAYNERIEEFKLPERRSMEQMLFEKKETAEKASAELAAGKSFEQVAASLPVLNKNQLQLGELTRQTVPVAADDVFALKEGEVSKPEQSGFGWHILKVTKILPAGVRPVVEVREQIVKDIASKTAEDAIFKLASGFEDALGGGATMEDAAKKLGQKVTTVTSVTRDGLTTDGSKPTLPPYGNFLEVAFNTEVKDHSRMVQADNGDYFMVHVDGVIPEHARPLADIMPQVTDAVKKEQAGTQVKALAQQIEKDLKAGKKPQEALAGKDIASSFEPSGALLHASDVVVGGKLNGKPLSPDLVAELFTLKPGSFTQAHALPDGSYMIGRLEQITPAPDIKTLAKDAPQLMAIREELVKSQNREAQFAYLQHLRTKYPVTIYTSSVAPSATESEEE